jgi:hypothetical protein
VLTSSPERLALVSGLDAKSIHDFRFNSEPVDETRATL